MGDSPSFDFKAQLRLLVDAVENGRRPRTIRDMSDDEFAAWVAGQRAQHRGRFSRTYWLMIREAVHERDRDRCAICGMNDLSVLEVHHIRPVRDGGRESWDNLITLCANHHRLADRGKISQDDLRARAAAAMEQDESDEAYIARLFGVWTDAERHTHERT
jgi:hypothetical protein